MNSFRSLEPNCRTWETPRRRLRTRARDTPFRGRPLRTTTRAGRGRARSGQSEAAISRFPGRNWPTRGKRNHSRRRQSVGRHVVRHRQRRRRGQKRQKKGGQGAFPSRPYISADRATAPTPATATPCSRTRSWCRKTRRSSSPYRIPSKGGDPRRAGDALVNQEQGADEEGPRRCEANDRGRKYR